MDGDSKAKVLKAGFRIIRTDDQPVIRIKELVNYQAWKTLEDGFKSKAERDRRFKELMKQDNFIND